MARTVNVELFSECVVSFLLLYLSTVHRVGASDVVNFSAAGGRRALQQNVDDIPTEEGKILVKFRNHVRFPADSKISRWGEGDGTACAWMGVTCDESNHVIDINLAGQQLEGTILPDLGQLQFLQALDLSDNHLEDSIPASLGSLQQMVTLNLSINSLSGFIPSRLYNCVSIQEIDLSHNSLIGSIPELLGSLQSLEYLSLWNNSLSGSIPIALTNCSALQVLVLSRNNLIGEIPFGIGRLQFLEELYLEANALSGPIPTSIGNCVLLRELHMGLNSLSGSIPDELGQLTRLQYLTLQSNHLEMGIPQSLKNCVSLRQISLGSNNLSGSIPDFLESMSNLTKLNLEFNALSGAIPELLSRLLHLEVLLLNNNYFTGLIPSGLGLSRRLQRLNLGNNQLSGEMLSMEGPELIEVRLNNNFLTGEILEFQPTSSSILKLDISHNLLTGSIPETIGSMRNAQLLDFSFNDLNGSIPGRLELLKPLELLNLSNNHLSGVIPSSLGQLPMLTFVYVSHNNLHGPIPSGWQHFSMESFTRNPGLCGLPTQVVCSGGGGGNRTWIYIAVAIGTLVGGIVALSAAIRCLWKRKSSRARLAPIMEISNFSEGVVLSVQDVITATEGFSEVNIIGAGSKSLVYKGVLPGGMIVAVKKLIVEHNERAANRLNHDMQILGTLRHRNWLQVYGYLSSPDLKALVLEYAPNGSLHHQLHDAEICQLTWKMRLEIARGIAQALVHIHHELVRPIIHLDLKPSNVLLDENFVAKVTDLGISKLLSLDSRSGDSATSALLGTTGYIPPEYGVSAKISTKGDVFNYGILLLELLTRKRPTFRFEGDVSLRQWVSNAAESPDGMATVLDSSIQNELAVHEDQIHLMLRVGLLCTETSPAKRPSMKDVRDMLMQIESLLSPK